jgi:hypothetical protein
MTRDYQTFVSWAIDGEDPIEGELLDIDLVRGLCRLECRFSFVNWAKLTLGSRFGLTETEADRLPMLPVPGAPVVASMENRKSDKIEAASLDELTDYLAPLIASGDFKFFVERDWKVTRYRQMAIYESEEEWLAGGFVVSDPEV